MLRHQHARLVEHVKSFIESVCLTIMGELREPMPSCRPPDTSSAASKLDKVLSGFNRLADALTEMRDDNGSRSPMAKMPFSTR